MEKKEANEVSVNEQGFSVSNEGCIPLKTLRELLLKRGSLNQQHGQLLGPC